MGHRLNDRILEVVKQLKTHEKPTIRKVQMLLEIEKQAKALGTLQLQFGD